MKLSSILLFLITFSIQNLSILSLTALQYGSEIRDIWAKDDACSTTETNTWTASALWTATIKTSCVAGYPLVGGYGVLGPASAPGLYYTKTYTGLPTHNSIYFSLTVWPIDSWDDILSGNSHDDYIAFSFDGVTFTGFDWSVFRFYENLCGNSWVDMRNNRVFGRVQHNSGSLTMRIIDNADQFSTDESVGFREVNLLFSTATTTNYICAVSQTVPSLGTVCSCREGEYLSGSLCVACHSLCSSCWGGAASQCYQCAVGSSFISNQCTACYAGCATCTGTASNQCSQCMTGYYLVNGNTCAQSCEAPLVKSLDANCRSSCSNPCLTTSFIYWDGSCNSTCAAPLQQDTQIKDFQLCYFPCGETEYLYWDGSCSADCFEPLLIGVYGGRNFCYYTCSSTQYLYWNGTCGNSCLSPFQITTNRGRKLCNRPCKEGEYLYWDGTCSSTCPSPLTARITDGDLYCDFGCASNQILYWDGSCEYICESPLVLTTQGTTRPRQYCGYPGTIATNYLYWNGSSFPVCESPFTKRITKGKNFCDNSCPSTSFIYWNSSCLGSCPPPFTTYTQAGLQYCDFPCPQNQFYYWDGSCDTTCPSILPQEVIGGSSPRYYCNHPCSSASDFLYWNGSCMSSCSNHFTQTSVHGRQLCHSPCDFTEYLAFNGSCLANCPLPFVPRKEAGVGFCDYPACLHTQYVAAWNYECIASCDPPLRIVAGDSGIQWCLLPCNDPLDFYYIKGGECKPTCESGAIVQDSVYPKCQAISKSSGAPQGFTDLLLTASIVPNKNSFVAFHKLSLPVKFTNIAASPRLQQFILSSSRSIFSWDIPVNAPESLKKEFVQRPLPPIFSQHGMISGFIVNCWRYFMLLCIFFITAFLFKVLEKVCQIMTWTNARPAVIKLREIFLWNFCLALVGYFADTFILYFCVHLSSLLLDNTNETINLFVGCFVMLAIVALIVFTLWIVRVYHAGSLFEPQVRDETSKETFYQRWKACLVLYRAYRNNNWRQQNFYAFYVIRMTLPMIITLFCWNIPALQACSQFIINFIMLIYLIFDMPLEKKINQVQILCYEFGALFVNIAALTLTFVNNDEDKVNKSYRVILGDMIIFGNVYLNFVPLAFLVAKLYFEAKYVYRYYRKRLNSDGGAWIRLLVIPLQQGLFGFEELLGDKSAISQVLTESPTLKHVKPNAKESAKVAPSPLDASSSDVTKDDYRKGVDPFSSSRISLNNSQMNNSTSPLSEKNSRNLSPYEKLRKLKKPTQIASPALGNSFDEVEIDKGQTPSRVHTPDSLNFSNIMQTQSLSPSRIILDK